MVYDARPWTTKDRLAPPGLVNVRVKMIGTFGLRGSVARNDGAPRRVPLTPIRGTVADKEKGFWASLAPDPDLLAQGLIDSSPTMMKIYKDGTFTTTGMFGKESARDRLLGFEYDIDSMRRKSVTGRGGAALMTSGFSLLAANNRGVVYVTVTGEQTKVRTFTTRNPSNAILSSIRSLKAVADSALARAGAPPAGDVPAQLKQLADLHAAGALSDAEFAAAKARLLR